MLIFILFDVIYVYLKYNVLMSICFLWKKRVCVCVRVCVCNNTTKCIIDRVLYIYVIVNYALTCVLYMRLCTDILF